MQRFAIHLGAGSHPSAREKRGRKPGAAAEALPATRPITERQQNQKPLAPPLLYPGPNTSAPRGQKIWHSVVAISCVDANPGDEAAPAAPPEAALSFHPPVVVHGAFAASSRWGPIHIDGNESMVRLISRARRFSRWAAFLTPMPRSVSRWTTSTRSTIK